MSFPLQPSSPTSTTHNFTPFGYKREPIHSHDSIRPSEKSF